MPHSKTVLLVEDHLETRAIHQLVLERHGYRVLTAVDGPTAAETARDVHPDLILMDVSLPIVDGLAVANDLKSDPSTRDIPIIVITAHSYGSTGRRAREAGCDGFLAKPCEPKRLLREVEDRIGGGGPVAAWA